MRRKIGVIIGSDSDYRQMNNGIQALLRAHDNREIEFIGVFTSSIYWNTEKTLRTIRHLAGKFGFFERIFYYLFRHAEYARRADVLICVDQENNLAEIADAYLRTLRDTNVAVINVAFRNTGFSIRAESAVVYGEFSGHIGFCEACDFAINETLPVIRMKEVKPPKFRRPSKADAYAKSAIRLP